MLSIQSALNITIAATLCLVTPLPMVSTAKAETAALQKESAPIEEVRLTLQKILEVVEKYPGKEQEKTRREKLREVINPGFDFREMSQRSLGALWRERSTAEQEDFVTVFSDLLAKTYLAKVELVKRDTVTVEKEEVDSGKALVKTIITYNGDKFPLDYKMTNRTGSWKVYDVVVENIGLVANYRNEFAGIIRKDGFPGLMVQLREKVAKGQ
jgi:phospholipid transport system substrate-binding protein